jgi:hypothetical protein
MCAMYYVLSCDAIVYMYHYLTGKVQYSSRVVSDMLVLYATFPNYQ